MDRLCGLRWLELQLKKWISERFRLRAKLWADQSVARPSETELRQTELWMGREL